MTGLLLLMFPAFAVDPYPPRVSFKLCEPPSATGGCDPVMDPSDADCTPFTKTQNDTDTGGYTDDPTFIYWDCKTECSASPDWETDCAYDVDDGGSPASDVTYDRWDDGTEALVSGTIHRVSMIVRDIGVTLEYTDDGYDDGPTVVFHAGGGANTAFNGGGPIQDYLRAYSNARTVAVKYEQGAVLVGAGDGGWHLRHHAVERDYAYQTLRTFDVLEWIRDKLQTSGEELGTVACSMGTLATLAAPVWHGLDSDIDYQALVGGPPMWDVNAGCGRLGVTYMDPYDAGIATDEIHGGVHLGTGGYCNTTGDHCLTYWPVQSKEFKNHVHFLDDSHADACMNSVDSPWPATDDSVSTFEGSSFNSVSSPDWTLTHTVDFFVDRNLSPDGDCDGTNCPDNPFYNDNTGGGGGLAFVPLGADSDETKAGPSTVRVYQTLLDNSTDASWTWQEGAHCDSFDIDQNTPPVIDAVVAGMDIEAARHELRVVKHEDNFTSTDTCLEVDSGAGENTFSSSETLTVNSHDFRVGTYHDDSGSPELQATLASGTEIDLPGAATVDRVTMLISGSTSASTEDLTVTFNYGVDPAEHHSTSVVASVPRDTVTTGTWSGTDWDVRPWSGDVTGNGTGCDDGAFEVRVRNPEPNFFSDANFRLVDSVEISYGTDLDGPLALTILTDSATWDEVVLDNDGACETSAPFTTACELEPVLVYWN